MSKIIVLDAGHGGSDSGAVCGKRYEKDDNLEFALAVEKLLKVQGFEVFLTHRSDATMSLKQRTDFANAKKADVYASLHRNSFINSIAKGVETWVYTNADSATQRLAGLTQGELVKVGVQANRGVKKGNYHVLRETDMPAFLLELGFIKNAKDNELFDTRFDAYAKAVTKGICQFCGVTFKEDAPKPPLQNDKFHRVQLGAFSDKKNAQKLADELRNKGYSPIII